MSTIIIHALAPIFLILLLGFTAGKYKLVDNKNVSLLNVFVMNFALPASLFAATVKTPWAGIVVQSKLIVILALSMWALYAFFYFLSVKVFKKTSQDAAVLTLTVALPNYAALGLPILDGVFPANSVNSLSVAVSIACGSVLLSPFCLLILEREKARKLDKNHSGNTWSMLPILMWRSFTKPIVLGPVLGVVMSAGGFNLSPQNILLMALSPLGLAATAGALFLTGVILSARQFNLNRVVCSGVVVKGLVQPLFAWAIALLIGADPLMIVSAVLMIGLGSGFFGVVFGNSYGVESADAESTLLLSSILMLLTTPLFIYLLEKSGYL